MKQQPSMTEAKTALNYMLKGDFAGAAKVLEAAGLEPKALERTREELLDGANSIFTMPKNVIG